MTKRKTSKQSWLTRLKSHPVLYNLLLIATTLVALFVGANLLLAIGTRHGMKRTVPEFKGLLLSDAERVANREGLELVVNDSLYVAAFPGGVVLEQLPAGGVDVKSGRKIYVTINSFSQKRVAMPYVARTEERWPRYAHMWVSSDPSSDGGDQERASFMQIQT